MGACVQFAKEKVRHNTGVYMNDHADTSGVKDRNNLDNYTEIDETFFDDIMYDVGNEDGILKIEDSTELKHPRYYVWTSFLMK